MEWELLIAGSNTASGRLAQLRWPGGAGRDRSWHAADKRDVPIPYEPPRVLFIGTVRDLTSGSASSGNKDANSQYYW